MLLLALGLRAGAAVAVQLYLNRVDSDFVIAGDAAGYLELGRKLAAREEYSAHNPPRRLMRMPGFPALLAVAVRLDSDRPLPMARALIVLCGTATCGVVCWLGVLLFDLRVGLIAGVLAAVSPTLIGFSAIVLTETPFALTLTLSLIPLAIHNDASGGRNVMLRFESDKVEVPADGTVLTVGPGAFSFDIDVIARSVGLSPMDVVILTPDGRRELARTRFQVRSTAVPGLGFLLSGAALGMLALWWSRSILRSRRSKLEAVAP